MIETQEALVRNNRAEREWEVREPGEYQVAGRYGDRNPSHGAVLRVKIEFSNLQWLKNDASAEPISEALVDDAVILSCEVKNIPEGAEMNVVVWEHDENNEHDHVADLTGAVKDGKLKIPWQVIYTEDNDDSASAKELAEKGYTLPEYHFIAEYGKVKSGQSPVLNVKDWIKVLAVNKETQERAVNRKCVVTLADGSGRECFTDENGYIYLNYLPFGKMSAFIDDQEN